MRILALYDIHGNIDALDAVLADPRAQDRDAVVVGGDAVPGAFAADVLDRLDALAEPTHWVRGNGEREVADADAGRARRRTRTTSRSSPRPSTPARWTPSAWRRSARCR